MATDVSCESRFRVMCLRCRTGEYRPLYGRAVDYGRTTDPTVSVPHCPDCDVDMVPVSYERIESQIAAQIDVERFKKWAQQLLNVSEYVGPGVGGSEAWLCAFPTCGGHSYVNLDGEDTPDGGYKRTPPASRDWHARDCPIRALVQDLGVA